MMRQSKREISIPKAETARRLIPHWLLRALAAGMFLLPVGAWSQNLSPLGEMPDWRKLNAYQETITREEFSRLLQQVYAPRGGWEPWIRVEEGEAIFRKSSIPLDDLFTLRFARDASSVRPPPAEYWRPRAALPPLASPDKPLAGMKIALDPGHLGGRWARMEERWFQIGDSAPIMEGNLTLQVAELLAPRLRALGAEVSILRRGDEPSMPLRPADLEPVARRSLAERGVAHPLAAYDGPADPMRTNSLSWESESLFNRADIRGRGRLVNETVRPDLVVCLHCNAEAWGDPAHPQLVDKNHLHLLVNGCYGPDELGRDDVRFEMLLKLLNRSHGEELPAAEQVASALAAATGLPPYEYTGLNALRVGSGQYVWARNLLANRIYQCPVIYLEPYVMNSPEVFARVQDGDYEGLREFGGVQRISIFREYADAVAEGLAAYGRERGHDSK
jgi:hypothetical protein